MLELAVVGGEEGSFEAAAVVDSGGAVAPS